MPLLLFAEILEWVAIALGVTVAYMLILEERVLLRKMSIFRELRSYWGALIRSNYFIIYFEGLSKGTAHSRSSSNPSTLSC